MTTTSPPGTGSAPTLVAPRPATRRDGISAATAMDAVTLLVGDLDRQLWYYRDVLGLDVLPSAGDAAGRVAGPARPDVVVLGRLGVPLVVLRHTPGLPSVQRRQAGLFHTAILFDDRAALASTLASVARHAPDTYVGSADHLVSLAFYTSDPEGNGVELYWDRSRDRWQHDPAGHVRMASLRLDPHAFLDEHLSDDGAHGAPSHGAVVGHVHLQVGDIASARRFYVGALGFDVTAEMPGALFISAGGYHHHMAMNTWNSAGAGPRASSLGLGEVRIVVPTSDDLDALHDRIAHAQVTVVPEGPNLRFEDPWRNVLRVSAAG